MLGREGFTLSILLPCQGQILIFGDDIVGHARIWNSWMDLGKSKMSQEPLQRIYQNGLVVDVNKLFGNVLSHTVARATSYYQCIIHILSLLDDAKVHFFCVITKKSA